MPANLVRSADDEKHWNEAKAQVEREYPGVTGTRKWKLVTSIFERMKHGTGANKPPTATKAVVDGAGRIVAKGEGGLRRMAAQMHQEDADLLGHRGGLRRMAAENRDADERELRGGGGDYHVSVNGETKSRHTTWNAAQEAARNHALSAGQSANIRIHHRPQGAGGDHKDSKGNPCPHPLSSCPTHGSKLQESETHREHGIMHPNAGGSVPGMRGHAGGEGSRGGHVIGHTRSGKPIYGANFGHPAHASFTRDDHFDAASRNFEIAEEYRTRKTPFAKKYLTNPHDEAGEAHRAAMHGHIVKALGVEDFVVKARDVKEPGKKGGKGYRTKSGKWRYGERLTGTEALDHANKVIADHQRRGDHPSMHPLAGGMYDEGHDVGARQTSVLNKKTYQQLKKRGATLTGETDTCNHCGKTAHRVALGEGGSGPWAWVHSHDKD